MKERDYLLATTAAHTADMLSVARGMIPVHGVITEKELTTLKRIMSRANTKAHEALEAKRR